MKYTNIYGLPPSIVRAATNDSYSKEGADFSATELLKPPQIVRLYEEHEDEITEDVSDTVWRLLGSGVHNVLEQAYDPDEGESEQRLHAEIDGVTISGAIDLREHGKITDYKVTATYTVMKGDFSSWEQQLNIYDWLSRENGHDVETLEIVAILRDWKKSQAERKRAYPEAPIKKLVMSRWSPLEQEEFIRSKIREHRAETPRPCSPEEIWGGVRCRSWCAVNSFCPQYNS